MRIALKILVWSLKTFFKALVWPFRSFKNFLKTLISLALLAYIAFSFIAIADYIKRNYGHYSKFLCGVGLERELEEKVVRVIGSFGEGSGFFIGEDQVLTSFHVISDEPSPKVVIPGGTILIPESIEGNAGSDLALLYLPQKFPDMALEFSDDLQFYRNEPLFAAGYALGSGLAGIPTVQKGEFVAFRTSSNYVENFIQTDIDLVEGMSGGPLVEQCGKVVGVNTSGVAGLSLFIASDSIRQMIPSFTDEDIAKIEVDTSTPEGAVNAFYTYIKARNLEKAFELISEDRKTEIDSYEEWTRGYENTLHVELVLSRVDEQDENRVDVKLASKDWVGEEMVRKFFEGYWIVVEEEGELKLNESNIAEIQEPEWDWFYEI